MPSAGPRPGELRMTAIAEPAPSTLDRIRHDLVGLKMPRALEALDHIVRRLEQGEIAALEAIDILLAEELTLRENSRIKTALRMGRLATIKTLAGFDFSFQPSLDRDRILTLAQLGFIARNEVVHFLGPPGTGKSHLAIALGVEASRPGKSVYFCTLAELIGLACQGRARGPPQRAHPLLLPAGAPDRRRDRLPARRARRRQSVLPARQRPLREGRDDPHLQPRLCRMGRGLRRSRRRHRAARPAPPPRRRRPDRGLSYRLRQHADLMPEHVRSKAIITPPTPVRPRDDAVGHPKTTDTPPPEPTLGNFTSALLGRSVRH